MVASARRGGDGWRAQAVNLQAAARVDQAGQRVRQDQPGVGQHAAPVARVMRMAAQIDLQVEQQRAARTEEQRGQVRRQARAVRCDEDVGLQGVAPLAAGGVQAGRADFLAAFDQHAGVEAQAPAALGQHLFQRGHVDAVLAFVVGRAARTSARLPRPGSRVTGRRAIARRSRAPRRRGRRAARWAGWRPRCARPAGRAGHLVPGCLRCDRKIPGLPAGARQRRAGSRRVRAAVRAPG